MATHTSQKTLTIESVSECLDAAKVLIETKKSDGGIMGYAALLLLFSVTDAIGHHLNVGSGSTRLETLNQPGFNLGLTPQQIYEIKRWFRNGLVHNASIVPGVLLTAETEGGVFEFDGGKPVRLRVPQLYDVVCSGWETLDRTDFNPLRHTVIPTGYIAPPTLTLPMLTSSPAASGMGVLPVSGSSATLPLSGGFVPAPERDYP
jgi:hypothetical protein